MHRISQSERNTIWLNNKTTIEKRQHWELIVIQLTTRFTRNTDRHTLSATK